MRPRLFPVSGALLLGAAGLGVALSTFAGCAGASSPERDPIAEARTRIEAALAAVEDEDFEGLGRSVWIGPADLSLSGGAPLYRESEHTPRPAASSIKTAYLVEFFSDRASALDEPVPDAAEVVGDESHPAVAHFDAGTRAEIREHLETASARTVGFHMIRGTDVSNAVYNAAANLVTAFLGGPLELTRRIHARDPDFAGIDSRRYMLAARDVTGDNTLSAASLAAVLAGIARGDTPGTPPGIHEAIREVLFLEDTEHGLHYFKGGSLNSDPLTRVLSGYYRVEGTPPGAALVYVFMVEIPGPDRVAPGDLDRGAAGERLQDLVAALRDAALPPAREALP